MIVVADAAPLRYLILIEHADVLPALYGQVIVPPAVLRELSNERTPATVRTWLRTDSIGCVFNRRDRSWLISVLRLVTANGKPSHLPWSWRLTRC